MEKVIIIGSGCAGWTAALYAARASRVRVQTEALAQRTNLYLALGGGFEAAATTASR